MLKTDQHANLGPSDVNRPDSGGRDSPASDGPGPADMSKIVQATEVLRAHEDRLNHSTNTLRKRLDTTLGAQPEDQPTSAPSPGSNAAGKPVLPDISNLFVAIENIEREYRHLVVQLERITPLTGE